MVDKTFAPTTRGQFDITKDKNNMSFNKSEGISVLSSKQNKSLGMLEGSVYFRGKPCPPNISFAVPPCSGPYPNYEIAIYADNMLNRPYKTIKSDVLGKFRLTLETGTYVIYTRIGPFKSDLKSTHFSITKNKTVTLPTLTIDTGKG
jgi:hypothetical protein